MPLLRRRMPAGWLASVLQALETNSFKFLPAARLVYAARWQIDATRSTALAAGPPFPSTTGVGDSKYFFPDHHFLAQLADCCFNFVVMWSFVNQSVGATNRHLAKREYVSLDVADEIRDTAVEVLRGVRARVTVSA